MITSAFLSILLALPRAMLLSVPPLKLSIPAVAYGPLVDVVNAVGYVFPVKALLPILAIAFSVKGVQIGWALLLRIKSFIPTMGA